MSYEKINSTKEFLEEYANSPDEKWRIEFRNWLDASYNRIKTNEFREFIKDVDFEMIKDKLRRAEMNSALQYLIVKKVPELYYEYQEYFTDKYKLENPTYPQYIKGPLKAIYLFETHDTYSKNNLYYGADVLQRC